MILTRPGFGYGPETFTTEFPRFQSIELARAYPDFYHESPHNFLLDACVDQGIPAMLLLLGCIGIAAYAGYYAIEKQRAIAAPLLAAFAAVLLCQQFVVFVLATALSFYLLLGMLVAIAANPAYRDVEPSRLRWAVSLCGAGAAAAMIALSLQLFLADRELAIASRFYGVRRCLRRGQVLRIKRSLDADWK